MQIERNDTHIVVTYSTWEKTKKSFRPSEKHMYLIDCEFQQIPTYIFSYNQKSKDWVLRKDRLLSSHKESYTIR